MSVPGARWFPLAIVTAALVVGGAGCSRTPADATPEGAVRLFVEKMEGSAEDNHAMREAYGLLGPRARANLKERADRASKSQGRRYEAHEMLAEGRFGLKFRPKAMTTQISGDEAAVEVRGEGADERALVKCAREGGTWRIEPELPDVVAPLRRPGGGT